MNLLYFGILDLDNSRILNNFFINILVFIIELWDSKVLQALIKLEVDLQDHLLFRSIKDDSLVVMLCIRNSSLSYHSLSDDASVGWESDQLSVGQHDDD